MFEGLYKDLERSLTFQKSSNFNKALLKIFNLGGSNQTTGKYDSLPQQFQFLFLMQKKQNKNKNKKIKHEK